MANLTGGLSRSLKSTFGESLNRHANFFTLLIVAVILIAGAGLVNGQAGWWISAVAVAGLFLVIFLVINARVLIKAALSLLTVLLTSNFALTGGFILDPDSTTGLVWMCAQFFLFFALLAMSYLITGYRSRWTGITLSLIAAVVSGTMLTVLLPPMGGIAASLGVGFGVFVFYYRTLAGLLLRKSAMPLNVDSEAIEKSVYDHADKEGWTVRKLVGRSHRGKPGKVDYLLWNENHALVIHPVELESKFSIAPTRRTATLSHKGYSINNWLLQLVNTRLPLWRSRNASMMLVLLDVNNVNGGRSETIGVGLPDTKKRIPVASIQERVFFTTLRSPAGCFRTWRKPTAPTSQGSLTSRNRLWMKLVEKGEAPTSLEKTSLIR